MNISEEIGKQLCDDEDLRYNLIEEISAQVGRRFFADPSPTKVPHIETERGGGRVIIPCFISCRSETWRYPKRKSAPMEQYEAYRAIVLENIGDLMIPGLETIADEKGDVGSFELKIPIALAKKILYCTQPRPCLLKGSRRSTPTAH